MPNGKPQFVAAGYGGMRIVSDDGRTWKNMVLSREGHVYRSLCYGNGMFVASGSIGGPGLHSVTSDGVSWQTICTPEAKDGGTGIKGNVFGDGKFIAFGGDPGGGGIGGHINVTTTRDGITWSPFEYPEGNRLIRRVAYAKGLFVGVGDAGGRSVSTDGVHWKQAPEPKAKNTLVDIAFGNGIFVGVGLHSLRMTTTDGVNWSNRQAGEEGEHLNSIVWCGDRFVAAGPDVTFISPDGINWKRSPNKNGPLVMTYGAGVFVGTQWKGRLLYSTDAVEWAEVHRTDFHAEALASAGQ